MTPENQLDKAIQKVITDPYNALKGKQMAKDTNDRIEEARQKVEDANHKVAEARPGNVVSQISAFGTPSTYEDPNHPEGKAIAQLDEERTQDLDKFKDDQESLAKAAEVRADEEVAAAEELAATAENGAVDEDEVARQREEVQSQAQADAEETRKKSR